MIPEYNHESKNREEIENKYMNNNEKIYSQTNKCKKKIGFIKVKINNK